LKTWLENQDKSERRQTSNPIYMSRFFSELFVSFISPFISIYYLFIFGMMT